MFVSCRVSCGNQITMRGIVFSSDAGLHNLQDMILTIVLTHVIHLSNIFNRGNEVILLDFIIIFFSTN